MSRRRCCCEECGKECDCFKATFANIADDTCEVCHCLPRAYYLKHWAAVGTRGCYWSQSGATPFPPGYYCGVNSAAGITLSYQDATRTLRVRWAFWGVYAEWEHVFPGTDDIDCEAMEITLGPDELQHDDTPCDFSNTTITLDYAPGHECPRPEGVCTGCDCTAEPADQLKVVFQGLFDSSFTYWPVGAPNWITVQPCIGCQNINGTEYIVDRVDPPPPEWAAEGSGVCVYQAQVNFNIANNDRDDCNDDPWTITILVIYNNQGFIDPVGSIFDVYIGTMRVAHIAAGELVDCSNFSKHAHSLTSMWNIRCDNNNNNGTVTVTVSNA
jgi:hypothetical protein